jgi:hypothetical protein
MENFVYNPAPVIGQFAPGVLSENFLFGLLAFVDTPGDFSMVVDPASTSVVVDPVSTSVVEIQPLSHMLPTSEFPLELVPIQLPVTRTRIADPCEGTSDYDNEIVIGTYTRAVRRMKIARYLEKRSRRNLSKKIHYKCRSDYARARPRVGGRFVNKVVKDDSDDS